MYVTVQIIKITKKNSKIKLVENVTVKTKNDEMKL
jgi:hypothetical protein